MTHMAAINDVNARSMNIAIFLICCGDLAIGI